MKEYSKLEVECILVGDFVDEGPIPPGAVHSGEVVRPSVLFEYVDAGTKYKDVVDFNVILRDERVVTVWCKALQFLPTGSNATNCSSLGFVVGDGDEEVEVANFPVNEVTSVLSGDIQLYPRTDGQVN
jgi:hypothetical protein